MSDTKHTKGPWHVDLDDHEADIHSGFGMVAKTMGHGKEQDDEGRANAILIAAAPDLLDELRKAHQIIRNALAVMTTEQKSEWGRLNERDAVDGEGITRANERQSVIVRAEAFHA